MSTEQVAARSASYINPALIPEEESLLVCVKILLCGFIVARAHTNCLYVVMRASVPLTTFSTVPRTASHARPRPTETTKHGMRAETSRRCLSPGGGLFYMRFRPVAYSPRTRKKTPQLGRPEPNVTAHCAHPQPRSPETTKRGMRAETSRQCLSPGGGLFHMRFRPVAYSPRTRKKTPQLGART